MIMNSGANAIFGKEDKKRSNIEKQKSVVNLGNIPAQHECGTVF